MNGGVEGGDDGESASAATAVSSMVTVGVERVSEAMLVETQGWWSSELGAQKFPQFAVG